MDVIFSVSKEVLEIVSQIRPTDGGLSTEILTYIKYVNTTFRKFQSMDSMSRKNINKLNTTFEEMVQEIALQNIDSLEDCVQEDDFIIMAKVFVLFIIEFISRRSSESCCTFLEICCHECRLSKLSKMLVEATNRCLRTIRTIDSITSLVPSCVQVRTECFSDKEQTFEDKTRCLYPGHQLACNEYGGRGAKTSNNKGNKG